MPNTSKPSRMEVATACMRSVNGPPVEVACPFCHKTDVAMFMGKVVFSAVMGNEQLCPVNVTLAALICAKSHMFFVLESDLAMALEKVVA